MDYDMKRRSSWILLKNTLYTGLLSKSACFRPDNGLEFEIDWAAVVNASHSSSGGGAPWRATLGIGCQCVDVLSYFHESSALSVCQPLPGLVTAADHLPSNLTSFHRLCAPNQAQLRHAKF
jgi:hypothetical protein